MAVQRAAATTATGIATQAGIADRNGGADSGDGSGLEAKKLAFIWLGIGLNWLEIGSNRLGIGFKIGFPKNVSY
jgi:hypothetical protein